MDQQDITSLENQAIQSALNNNWEKAIDLNLEILQLSPKNTSSLNRLGIAYLKTSQASLAQKTLRQVLKINPNNPIATKNLSNLKHQSKNKNSKTTQKTKSQTISFIEEPGISRIIPLIKPGSPQIIANLEIGQELILKSSIRRIKVFSEDKHEYIGRLPDNLSLSISRFMKLGYKYQIFLQSTSPKFPKIFIQETKRPKRLKDIPSFPLNNKNKKIINVPNIQPVNPPLQIFDPLTKED